MSKANDSAAVWVVDDDRSIRWVLEKALGRAGIPIRAFANANLVVDALADARPAAVLTDIRMPGMDGLKLLERLRESDPELPVIVMTAYSDLDSAVSSYRGGAFEYLPKPFDIDEAVAAVQRAVAHGQQSGTEVETPAEGDGEIIGQAPAMQEVFRAIGRLSNSNVTVLINGPSGSGKELIAKALHQHSPRALRQFVPLNVAAIPGELIESELFGHEKGAFTGASGRRVGRFEQSNGGTLFLDEIGDMPMKMQTRLLRVIAEGEFHRVGGYDPIKVDVRIIAATHQQLEELVQKGKFREDLFHRLNVIRVHVPGLADRREDIPAARRPFHGARHPGNRRGTQAFRCRNAGLPVRSAVAGQCSSAREYLPLAGGDGHGAPGAGRRPASGTERGRRRTPGAFLGSGAGRVGGGSPGLEPHQARPGRSASGL